jgi:hypothetical protein
MHQVIIDKDDTERLINNRRSRKAIIISWLYTVIIISFLSLQIIYLSHQKTS